MKLSFQKISQNTWFSLAVFFIFVIFFIMTLWGENGLFRLVELNRLKTEILHEKQRVLEENLVHFQEIQRLKKLKYIEQQARSDMGYLLENETLFVIPEN